MKLFLTVVLALQGQAVAGQGAADDCAKAARKFLRNPSKNALKDVNASHKEACWGILGASNANLYKLLGFVENGNTSAAEYLSTNLDMLDGGNLEDSLISLGQFSELRMEAFLNFSKSGYLSDQEMTDALTMLPLFIGDDQKRQISVLEKRRKKILEVEDKNFELPKQRAIRAIDDFISEIVSKPGHSELETPS